MNAPFPLFSPQHPLTAPHPRLLDSLNTEQLKAVTLPHVSALVLAGAGSGKTRVLTTRIAYLIQTGQVSPAGILAVTFTNKAAKEMLARLSAMMPINTRGMWIGTFHGLCNRLLRAHYRDANLPQTFQILDSADQQSAVKRLLRTLNVDEEKFKPREMCWFFNSCKDQGLRAGAVEAQDEFTRRQVELYRAYDEQCQREGVVDFAELLLRCYELLGKNPPLLEHYRERFKFILVDEFQDTNRLQYQWIRLLAGGGAAMFAVGDDDQSIYKFRGAEVGNMRDFQRDFAGNNVIKLEQNYRSQGNILDAANAVIQQNKERLGKNLWTEAGKGEPLRIYAGASDNDEAQFIIEEVKSLNRGGTALINMALLYRSNAQSRVLEHALFRAGVAYKVYGGLRFFERQEIKHALAYLRIAANPDDDGAFSRVVNFPPRGIGARTLEQVQELARRDNVSMHAAATVGITAGEISGRSASALGAFLTIAASLKISSTAVALQELVDECLEKSGLRAHYQAEREGADRLENLAELINATAQFEEEYDAEDSPLVGFLTHASLEAGEHEAGAHDDALQLMTVHSAKGLEFTAVFLSGLEEGLFPHENSITDFESIEEERRLMYVAITRARERLYLSFAAQRMLHGQMRYGIVSRFVDEIPPGLCKWIMVPDKQAGYLAGQQRYPAARNSGGLNTAQPWGSRSSGAWQEGRGSGEQHYARHGDRSNALSAGEAGYGREGAPDTSRANFETRRPDAHPFAVGQNVMHAKFGEGVVVNFEGSGLDARVQVKFRIDGTKWLALQYAKLTALS
ncbi:MAG: UvrD-helicase domain-containing protein [Betaproteobacteria bacterium]